MLGFKRRWFVKQNEYFTNADGMQTYEIVDFIHFILWWKG